MPILQKITGHYPGPSPDAVRDWYTPAPTRLLAGAVPEQALEATPTTLGDGAIRPLTRTNAP